MHRKFRIPGVCLHGAVQQHVRAPAVEYTRFSVQHLAERSQAPDQYSSSISGSGPALIRPYS